LILPTISIITVTYNAGNFIQATLRSVTRQTFLDYEHLIVDGASTDDTLEIINKNKSDKLIVYSEPDNGLYDAMNKAIMIAKGDYVIFLNAGDEFYSDDTLLQIFSKANGEDFIYGNTVVINKDGMTEPYHKPKPLQKELSWRSFINGMVICHQSMIVKKDKIAMFMDKDYEIAADLDWVINTTKNCKSFLDSQLYVSKFLGGGMSQNNRGKAFKERFLISLYHFGFLKTILQHVLIGYSYFNNRIKCLFK
jgi:glycosyltransferase involved in cell wall biosynthesis